MNNSLTSLLLVGALLGTTSAHAAIIGHWQFEDSPGYLVDSSANGNDLTAVNSNGGDSGPTQTTTPAAFNPVPLTGANAKAALFDGEEGAKSATSDQFTLSEADAGQFPTTALTIEMFVQRGGAVDTFHTFASQFITQDNRAWRMFQNDNESWTMQLSSSGGADSGSTRDAGVSLIPGRDYYIATVLEFGDFDGDGDAVDGRATFYTKDLTAGTPLVVTPNVLWEDFGPMFDSSADFVIGGQDEDNNSNKPFEGIIDEVRFSDTALSQSELLIVPEPSTFALFAGLVGLSLVMRRRLFG